MVDEQEPSRSPFPCALQTRVLILVLAFATVGAPFASEAVAGNSGPSQPEFRTFAPAGKADLVDPFTGDFHYEIPLFTVPAPNGSYPVNLSYRSGIAMEEASWVGLGWTLNPAFMGYTRTVGLSAQSTSSGFGAFMLHISSFYDLLGHTQTYRHETDAFVGCSRIVLAGMKTCRSCRQENPRSGFVMLTPGGSR